MVVSLNKKRLNYHEYIIERINELNNSRKQFRLWSIVLISVGVCFIILSFLIKQANSPVEFIKFGLGLISSLVPFYLNNESSKRKTKIIDLQLLQENIDLYPEKKVIIIDQIIKNL